MPRSFDEVVGSYSPEVQALTRRADETLVRLLPGVERTVDDTTAVIGYGYGPGYRGMVCTLILSKSGVKIGIVRGAELADPHGLLEGKGKTQKFIQLKTVADLERAGVKEMVRAAHTAWKERMA